MKAFVFAAGYGTRMAPHTDVLPKPAMPFYGRPAIAHTLEWLARWGVDTAVVNLHHLAGDMRRVAQASAPAGMTLLFSEESEILGTGGGLVLAREHFRSGDTVIAVNGDVYTDLDLNGALRRHADSPAPVTLVLTDDPAQQALFGVGFDVDKRITDFWGEPHGSDFAIRRAAYTGIQLFDPVFLDALPESGFACVKESGWIPWLRAGGELSASVVRGHWFDLGTPDRYLDAHMALIDQRVRLSGWPERAPGVVSADPIPVGLTVVPPVVIGPNLGVAGRARLGPYAFLGADVHLAAGTSVEFSVVWDGAHVEGAHARTVRSSRGRAPAPR